MAFFDQNGTQPKREKNNSKRTHSNTSDFDREATDKLHHFVVKKLKFRKRWSRSIWTNEFRMLRNELQDDTKRITSILEWLFANYKNKRCPRIDSAKAFRKQFNWLEDLSTKIRTAKSVELTHEEELMHTTLRGMGWPKTSVLLLPETIRASMDGWEEIKTKIRHLRLKYQDKTPAGLFARHLDAIMSPQYGFVNYWLVRLHQQIGRWDNFNGDLRDYALKFDSEKFHEWAAYKSIEFAASTSPWNKLLKDATNAD